MRGSMVGVQPAPIRVLLLMLLLVAATVMSSDRLQRVLATHAVKPAVLAELLGVNRVDDDPVRPDRFRHRLSGELAERIAIALRGPCRDCHGTFDRGIIRRQEDAPLRLHRQDAVAGLEVEMVGHVLRQGCRDRSPSLA